MVAYLYDGYVWAGRPGTTTITASALNRLSADCTVTVPPRKLPTPQGSFTADGEDSGILAESSDNMYSVYFFIMEYSLDGGGKTWTPTGVNQGEISITLPSGVTAEHGIQLVTHLLGRLLNTQNRGNAPGSADRRKHSLHYTTTTRRYNYRS